MIFADVHQAELDVKANSAGEAPQIISVGPSVPQDAAIVRMGNAVVGYDANRD